MWDNQGGGRAEMATPPDPRGAGKEGGDPRLCRAASPGSSSGAQRQDFRKFGWTGGLVAGLRDFHPGPSRKRGEGIKLNLHCDQCRLGVGRITRTKKPTRVPAFTTPPQERMRMVRHVFPGPTRGSLVRPADAQVAGDVFTLTFRL